MILAEEVLHIGCWLTLGCGFIFLPLHSEQLQSRAVPSMGMLMHDCGLLAASFVAYSEFKTRD